MKNFSIVNMRITKEKPYYMHRIERFTEIMIDSVEDVVRVEFGKQDIRGGFSICLYTNNHCVKQQKHFSSKDEMLGFVVGFTSHNDFKIHGYL